MENKQTVYVKLDVDDSPLKAVEEKVESLNAALKALMEDTEIVINVTPKVVKK